MQKQVAQLIYAAWHAMCIITIPGTTNSLPLIRKDEAMRRILLTLAAIGVLAVAANQALAGVYVGVGGYGGGYHGGHHGHHGYCAPVVVAPRVYLPPRVVVPYPDYPPVVYPRVYRPSYYYPAPQSGFYYRGPGVSIGVGF